MSHPFSDLFKYFRKLEGEDPSTDKQAAAATPQSHRKPSAAAPKPVVEQPSQPREKGVIIRYGASNGYGFIVVTEGPNAEKSIFLHASRIPEQFIDRLAPGHEIHFSIAPGKKGPVCADVFWLSDKPMPVNPKLVAANKNFATQNSPEKAEIADTPKKAVGTVKFYNSAKQFGFVSVDDGTSRDIFMPRTVFEKLGIAPYNASGTRVEIEYLPGKKGFEAVNAAIYLEPAMANDASDGNEMRAASPRM